MDVHRETTGQMGHVGPWLKVWSRGATLTTWWRTRAIHVRESSEQGSIMLKNYKQRKRRHLEAKRQKQKAKARSKTLILSRWWIEISITIDISIELDVHRERIGQMGHVGPWLKVWSRGALATLCSGASWGQELTIFRHILTHPDPNMKAIGPFLEPWCTLRPEDCVRLMIF